VHPVYPRRLGPQPGGGYHRHALSECTPHIHERNALVGYALDGFGIFSPYDQNGKELFYFEIPLEKYLTYRPGHP